MALTPAEKARLQKRDDGTVTPMLPSHGARADAHAAALAARVKGAAKNGNVTPETADHVKKMTTKGAGP
jgi:hypothetical protein